MFEQNNYLIDRIRRRFKGVILKQSLMILLRGELKFFCSIDALSFHILSSKYGKIKHSEQTYFFKYIFLPHPLTVQ